jgi:hypothetical protein
MTDGFPDRGARDTIYREYADMIAAMVDGRRKHESEHRDCSAAPLCLGPAQMQALTLLSIDPPAMVMVIVAAAGELDMAGRRVAELMRRLDIQRELTAAATRAADENEARAKVAEDAEQALAAAVDDKDNEIARLAAELTAWEEAAEVLAPTHPTEEGS